MDQIKTVSVGVAVAVIGAWASHQFGGVEVPLEVQGAAAVVLTAIGRKLKL